EGSGRIFGDPLSQQQARLGKSCSYLDNASRVRRNGVGIVPGESPGSREASEVEPMGVDGKFRLGIGENRVDGIVIRLDRAVALSLIRAHDDVAIPFGSGLKELQRDQRPAAWVHQYEQRPTPVCVVPRGK